MAIFGKNHPAAGEPDPYLVDYSKNQLDVIRRLYVEAFAKLGVTATSQGDHLLSDDGAIYGLDNLARSCLLEGDSERAWRRTCETFASRMLDNQREQTKIEELSDDELHARAFPRLVHAEALETGDGAEGRVTFDYARVVEPDLRVILVADFPQSVAYLSDDMLADRDLASVWEAAFDNLAVANDMEHLSIDTDDPDGVIEVWQGESVYVATQALRLPDLFASLDKRGAEKGGVILALPHRQMVAAHVAVSAAATLQAVNTLAALVLDQYRTAPGPLSPDLWWWRDGALTKLSTWGPDGELQVTPPDDLTAILNQAD